MLDFRTDDIFVSAVQAHPCNTVYLLHPLNYDSGAQCRPAHAPIYYVYVLSYKVYGQASAHKLWKC